MKAFNIKKPYGIIMGFTLKEICEAVGGYTEGDATIQLIQYQNQD